MMGMGRSKGGALMGALIALAVLVAAPAAARRPADGIEHDTAAAIRALHDFARCVARDHWAKREGRGILAMDYRSDAYHRALRAFVEERGRCLPPYQLLSSNSLLFAGALAEAFLPRTPDLAALVAYDPARPPLQARDEIEMMSLCTVRGAPGLVAALLATQAASPEEAAALRAVAPQLGQCLRSGARARVNPLAIRALLALAAWRLAEQNEGAATGP